MAENFVNIIREIRGSTNDPATDTSCIYGDIKSMHKEYKGFKQITDEERLKLENIEEGATKNSTDSFLLARENHTGNMSIANVQDTPSRMAMTIHEKNKLEAINVDATKNDTDANLRNRATHTGTQSIDTITDTSTHVKMSVDERSKLSTIATGATKNATDAELRSRSTHTGKQSADSIVDGLVNAAYTLQEKNKLSVLSTTVPPAHTHDNTSIINLSYSKLTGVPETFYPSEHLHSMDEITTGNLDATRINQTNSLQFVNSIEKEKITNAESMNNKGTPFGYAPLDGNGKINPSYLDALNVIDVFTPINQEAMLLLTSAKPGDIAYVQDSQNTYMLVALPVHLQNNWKKMNSGIGVITFNGLNGVVSVGTDEIPEGSANVYFTNERVDDRVANLLTPGTNVSIVYNDDTNQIIINANDTSVEWSEIQNKPNTKIDVNLSGEISGSGSVILSQLGNGTLNIENITSDTYELRNSNIQWHIAHDKTNPHNVTKDQVGLGNVDNTSDLDKPVSNPTKVYVENLMKNNGAFIINKPVIVTPVNLTANYIGAVTSTYNTSANYEGLQTRVIWECALDANFTNIIDSYEGSSNLTSWVPNIGLALTKVYVRTKQISDSHRSEYSDVISFTTPDIYVTTPTLTVKGSTSSVTLTPILSGSAFNVFNGTDTHLSSDWRILKASDNSVVWESLNDTVNLLNIVPSQLPKNTDLVFKVRYNSSIYGSSAWVEVTAKTLDIYVENPILTVEGTPNEVTKNPTISGSAFSVMNGTDTHESTDYQAVRVSDGVVVWESLANTTNKTSIKTGDLVESIAYIFKMRYKGATYGYSQWVQVTGTTKAVFAIPAGIQGTKGFSVAPTTEPFAVLGLAEMVGTNDPSSDNYGNYIHTNGSIVCWCPKAYYRVGHSSSPRFAKYGANALDMVGTDVFANEAVANVNGYALHRCFINGGKEQAGVFVDKYTNSKDGNSASKSVFGGVPISLATTAGYTVSNGMTGCTGILADAVVLSKARGERWNATSAFIYAYLALVSVAQAQAATSTADVAWYDPTGVKNYPKGCNNNALSDVDDTTVVYATAGDSGNANKPKTGATANFAKTTHNGSNNGVADLNGGMFEATIGITNFGDSGTATTAIANDTIYVLKHSTDIATLTAGWNGATDAWGNAANLATKYDSVTSPHPLGSSTGAVYWGNGTNAVLQNDLSGVNRDVCGFIPKNSSSTGATGANLFGNDYMYKYNVQNMVPLACGHWGYSAYAGVFYRHFYYNRSLSNYNFGFRASAYFA